MERAAPGSTVAVLGEHYPTRGCVFSPEQGRGRQHPRLKQVLASRLTNLRFVPAGWLKQGFSLEDTCEADLSSKGRGSKGTWRMPWRQEIKKDVASCEKPRGAASRH